MNILLIGEYYSQNLGDPVLCTTVERIIKSEYPEANIVPYDMSGNIGFDQEYDLANRHIHDKICLKVLNKFPQAFRKITWYRAYECDAGRYMRAICLLNDLLRKNTFDVAVFAGGSIFMDYFAGIIYYIVKKLKSKGIKIVFHACGMSSLIDESLTLLKAALKSNNIVSISLRDSYLRFNELFTTRAIVTETYDTALGCSAFYEPSKYKMAEMGVGVIATSKYYEHQKKLIQQFLGTSKSWKIFTNGARYDEVIALRILKELGIAESDISKYLAPRPETSEELIQTITAFEKIVSYRMHSQIVASSYGIPSVGFVWDLKVKEFFKKLGFLEKSLEPDKPVTVEQLCMLLNNSDRVAENAQLCGERSKKELIKNIRIALERK